MGVPVLFRVDLIDMEIEWIHQEKMEESIGEESLLYSTYESSPFS
jgi:hypothetical protein